MSKILSDEEIDIIEKDCWENLNTDNCITFARAIEQAVMAKLLEQKPVAWKDTTFTSDENEAMTSEPVLLGYEGWESLPDGTELFTNPAPSAPEVFIQK